MSKRSFTSNQREQLLSNIHVRSCTEKYITFQPSFKKEALHIYEQEHLTPRQIFINAGFDMNIIGSNTPKECLARWKRTRGDTHKKGIPKGTHRKKQFLDLQMEIDYLKAENAFLKKLRAQRAER